MNTILIFVSEQWLNLLFGAVGIVGTYLTYRSRRSAQDSEKAYQHLFKLAELHIDKSLTDKQLADRKEEVQQEARKIEGLQNQIRQEIPIAARRAVLRDRFETQLQHFHEIYSSLMRARDQLNRLGQPIELSSEIKRAIESEIRPEYAVRARKSELRGYLTITTAGAAIASALLPYPFSRVATWIILVLFALPILILLLRLSWPSDIADVKRTVIGFLRRYLVWIGLGLILVGFAVLVDAARYDRYLPFHSDILLLTSGGLMLAGLACSVLRIVLWIRMRFAGRPEPARSEHV
jgi:hypothetical protein